jgi:hypothetical protein
MMMQATMKPAMKWRTPPKAISTSGSAMNVRIVLIAFCCLASNASAQQGENLDDLSLMTREQWRARVEAAKARIQEMRREGKSFVPAPENDDPSKRILEDGTLVHGDFVATKQGTFQFIGRSEPPHSPYDFQPVARDQQLRYNPYTGRREYAPQDAIPQYNPYTRRRELAGPGETLQYNPYTKRREYAPEGAVPRYNPYTKRRELAAPN